MTARVALLPRGGLVAQHRSRLEDDRIDEYSVLIPADCLAAIRLEIEESLRQASSEEVTKAVAVLFGSLKSGDVFEDPRLFANEMIRELGRYPPDILDQAIARARRTFDWLPSIAEMVALCEGLIDPRRRWLRTLDRMNEERRRREEAERLEADRECRDREWITNLEARTVEIHGKTAPLPGDLDLAIRLRPAARWCGRFVPWSDAIETSWGVALCRRLAALARQRGDPLPVPEAEIAVIEVAIWHEHCGGE